MSKKRKNEKVYLVNVLTTLGKVRKFTVRGNNQRQAVKEAKKLANLKSKSPLLKDMGEYVKVVSLKTM